MARNPEQWTSARKPASGNAPAIVANTAKLLQEDSPLAALHVEHIIPRCHGGSDELDNLALACIDCNLHKGTNLTGIDPQTNRVAKLFHPRHQRWDDHFAWSGIYVVGKTPVGRTTIRVLNMNSEDQLALRS